MAEAVLVIGLIQGAGSLVLKCAQLVKTLRELRQKSKTADSDLHLLAGQIETIKFAWDRVEKWTVDYQQRRGNQIREEEVELLSQLNRRLECGDMVISALLEDLPEIEHMGSQGRLNKKQKAKVLWNETQINEHKTRIRDQVSTMTLLIQILNLPRPSRQSRLDDENTVKRFAKSDRSALSINPSKWSYRSRSSHNSISSSEDLIYIPLDFEDMLFTSRVYKRNYRVAGSKYISPDDETADITQESLEEPGMGDLALQDDDTEKDINVQKDSLDEDTATVRQSSIPSIRIGRPAATDDDVNLESFSTSIYPTYIVDAASSKVSSDKDASAQEYCFPEPLHGSWVILTVDQLDEWMHQYSRYWFSQQVVMLTLRYVALNRYYDVLDLLLQNILRRFIDAPLPGYGRSLTNLAIELEDNRMLGILLQSGASTNVTPRSMLEWGPMHLAALNETSDSLQSLIEYNVPVNSFDDSGWTPLELAFWQRRIENAKLLLDHGAGDFSDSNFSLWIALKYLEPTEFRSVFGNRKLRLGIATISNLLRHSDTNHLTARLRSHGFDLSRQERNGESLVHKAIKHGNIEVFDFLLEANEGFRTQTTDEEKPIHYAVSYGRIDMLMELALRKEYVSSQDRKGESPLHKSIQSGNYEAFQILLDAGADLECKTRTNGEQPIHFAARFERLEMLGALIKRGANIDALSVEDKTPLTIAKENNSSMCELQLRIEGSQKFF